MNFILRKHSILNDSNDLHLCQFRSKKLQCENEFNYFKVRKSKNIMSYRLESSNVNKMYYIIIMIHMYDVFLI